MPRVRIVVGEFRRRMFGDSLMATLRGYSEFDVEPVRGRSHLRACLNSEAPTVIILDSGAEPLVADVTPGHANVAVIRIGDEGRETQVLLYQVAPEQIRRIAGLVARCVTAAAPMLAPMAQTICGALGGPRGWPA